MTTRPISWDCTHAANGLRTLMGPAQGHRMKATREECAKFLKAVVLNNNEATLVSVYGKQAIGTFRVDEFECWEHGDPKGIYVDDERGAS